jgi:hypothetical protein
MSSNYNKVSEIPLRFIPLFFTLIAEMSLSLLAHN